MKITILNGENKSENGTFTGYIGNVADALSENNSVDVFNLSDMNLKFCTGCWSCWWKTPGQCASKDDAEPIFRSVINSDLLIFSSPITAGFTSSELKKITDRLIVLIHPYIQIREDECHHQKRYEKYPDLGLILEKNIDTDDEDLKIISDIYDRLALNFDVTKRFLFLKDQHSIKEIADEITNN